MRIKRINIRNFGPFYDEHTIEFNEDGEGVHLIRGNTGQGKTSIQRAILWGLYGSVKDRKNEEIPATTLINRTTVEEDIYQFWVSITLKHEGKEWTISRKMEGRKHSNRSYQMELHVLINDEIQENPEYKIQRLLPQEVSRFFFFDGEMLRDYEELLEEDTKSMKILRDSVERILGIPHLRMGRKDLKRVKKSFERERNKLIKRLGGQKYDDLADKLSKILEKIEEREDRIEELEEKRDGLEMEIKDLKRKQNELEGARKLTDERKEYEQEIKELERKKDNRQTKLMDLTSHLYKSVLKNPAENILEKLKKEHERVMGKYNKKQKLVGKKTDLEKSKKSAKCQYCGTVLDQEKLDNLEQEIKEIEIRINELTEVPEPNLAYENSINRIEEMVKKSPDREKISEIEKKIEEIDHEIARYRSLIDDINEKLGDSIEEDIRDLQTKLNLKYEELGSLKTDIRTEKDRKLEDLDKKSRWEGKIKSISREELETLTSKIELADYIRKVFKEAISEYREERRKEVEAIATEIFRRIKVKESFRKLRINENFGLSILTGGGRVLNKGAWRSAGEEQIVALSLIGALNECVDTNAPIFMDTPFGRLDTKHGEQVMSYIPEMSEQVVLLVTDREFGKESEKVLSGKIATDLTVVHKNEEEGSEIYPTRREA